jgi:endonuclease YncB( thermonuclease family)
MNRFRASSNMPKVTMPLAAFAFFLLFSSCVFAFPARVVWVADGDTVRVLKQDWSLETVRIYGLDSPERDQPDGWWASTYTLGRLILREVEVVPVERDSYGRLVARIRLDGESFNAQLIRAGYAWVYDRYCDSPVCARYRRLEREARRDGRGLWAGKEPIPPWRWRRGERPDSNWRFW